MKNKLVPVLICSLLYLAGCATKEDSVKPDGAAAEVPSKPLSSRKPRGAANSGARIGYTSWQKFTYSGRAANSDINTAVDIAVGDNVNYDRIYIITLGGDLYYFNQVPSSASFNPTTGFWTKASIYFNNSLKSFPAAGGKQPRIIVDQSGYPWIVDGAGNVYYTTNYPFAPNALQAIQLPPVPGGARDIGLGGGNVYVTTGATGNNAIYKRNATSGTWDQVFGQTAAHISVDQLGRPWVLRENGPAYYQDNGAWQPAGPSTGQGRDLGASNYEYVQCVGTGSTNNVFMYDYWNGSWYQPYGSGWGIRVDTDREGYIYLLNNESNGNSHVFTF